VLLASTLALLQQRVAQCDHLIVNAHKTDASGMHFFQPIDREQITVAAFLNLFIAWEGFIEDTLANLMVGGSTLSGKAPTRYVLPVTEEHAKKLTVGLHRYFDYANHENLKKIVVMYFKDGYPFEPCLSSIDSDLRDLRTMRNASAHITSTTQASLEALAQRILTTPKPGISLYTLLTSIDPRSPANLTVIAGARDKLLAAAIMIANG
jgi:hypothetical protein